MRKCIRQSLLALALMLCTALSACDLSGFIPGPRQIHGTLYWPYLESVDAPATVHVGDPVNITLHFSASLNPWLFTDPLMTWDQSSSGEGNTRFDINYYLFNSAERNYAQPSAPPSDTIRQDGTFTVPGTYTYRYWSAATSSQGGKAYPGDITYGMGIPTEPGPNAKLTEVTIKVLPAE